ncbi:MAG: hypothetical protein U9P44_04250 [archaeon]|nr:hypothetical protein [archaeon]
MYEPLVFNAFIILVFLFFYSKNKNKAGKALKCAFKSLRNVIPLIMIMLIVLIFVQNTFSEEFIRQNITAFSGPTGYFIAAFLGAVVHIPLFISFPLGGQLLQSGVNPGFIAVLITSLVMVHTFTIPLEIKEMGLKFALARNILCLVSAIIIGFVMGVFY